MHGQHYVESSPSSTTAAGVAKLVGLLHVCVAGSVMIHLTGISHLHRHILPSDAVAAD